MTNENDIKSKVLSVVEQTEAEKPKAFDPERIFKDMSKFPIQAIGLDGKVGYFADRQSRTFMSFTEKEIKQSVSTFFITKENYLEALNYFPYTNKNGDVVEIDMVSMTKAIWNEASKNQNFKPEEKMRGLGLWLDTHDNLIINLGQNLYIKEKNNQPLRELSSGWHQGFYYFNDQSKEISNQLFVAAENLTDIEYKNSFNQCLEKLSLWCFQSRDAKKKGDKIWHEIILGWLCSAILGDANIFRPHLWITGDSGSGKSDLGKKIIMPSLQGIGKKAENATEAALRHELQRGNIPFILDEAEHANKTSKMDELIELARASSTGGTVSRGTPSGKTIKYHIRSSFCFLSISAVALLPQDVSRILIMNLVRPTEEKKLLFIENLEKGNKFSYDFSVCFRAVIKNWQFYQPLQKYIANQMMAQKFNSRIAAFYSCIFTPFIMAKYHVDLPALMTGQSSRDLNFIIDKIIQDLIEIVDVLNIQQAVETKPEQKIIDTILEKKIKDTLNRESPVSRLISDAINYVILKQGSIVVIKEKIAVINQISVSANTNLDKYFTELYGKPNKEADLLDDNNNDNKQSAFTADKIQEKINMGKKRLIDMWENAYTALNNTGINIKIYSDGSKDNPQPSIAYLCIADNNQQLKEMLYMHNSYRAAVEAAETVWQRELVKLKGAKKSRATHFSKATTQRCTWIPINNLDISIEVHQALLEFVKMVLPHATSVENIDNDK